MNERIKELADRCFSTLPHEDELEKFAELIVRECAEVSKNYAHGSMPVSIAHAIKEHFGVEIINEQTDYIFHQEIARELMLKHNPNLTQKEFEKVWSLCQGNPWNAGILYKMLELKNES